MGRIKNFFNSVLVRETGISLFLKISQAIFSFMSTVYQVALTKWHLRSVECGEVEVRVDGDKRLLGSTLAKEQVLVFFLRFLRQFLVL